MEATEHVALPARSWGDSGDFVTVLGPDGHADTATDPRLDADHVVEIYKTMVRTRLVDQRLAELGREGRIGVHPAATGEEAAVVGAAAALREHDWVFPSCRDFGAFLWRGMPLESYLDQVFGNAGDAARGRQMPGHATARSFRIASAGSLAGTHLPHAVGLAWAARIRGDDLVSAAFFGGAATSTADFHTALNFAGVFGVPVVFLCRNLRCSGDGGGAFSPGVADRAVAYGIRAARCDGSDVLATYRTVRDAVQRAATGEGATLVELRTTRLDGDGSGASDGRAGDGVERARKYLETLGAWDAQRERGWREAVRTELDECIARAAAKPAPALETLVSDVYGASPWHLREQERALSSGPRSGSGG